MPVFINLKFASKCFVNFTIPQKNHHKKLVPLGRQKLILFTRSNPLRVRAKKPLNDCENQNSGKWSQRSFKERYLTFFCGMVEF